MAQISQDSRTECGFLGASVGRPAGDKAWNYIRPPPSLMAHVYPKPITDDTYEFVFLESHPGLRMSGLSNSNDPPNSWHSRDIYTPHKDIPGAWKPLGRLDDRITLLNGEKVLPLPIEGTIRQHPLVKEAVVFGTDRAVPGLLLFKSEAAETLEDDNFVAQVWPTVDVANRAAEDFSQIGQEMIVPIPFDVTIPITEKGNIVRAQTYSTFQKQVEEAYIKAEQHQRGTKRLSGAKLEDYLVQLGRRILGSDSVNVQDDLFSHGMNSLQAIQMRVAILRDLDLGGEGKNPSMNVIFEQGSVANLTAHLEDIRLGEGVRIEKPISAMEDLIAELSVFPNHHSGSRERPSAHTVVSHSIPGPDRVFIPGASSLTRIYHSPPNYQSLTDRQILTGATGSLGAQILSILLGQPNISKIFCLIRGDEPGQRLRASFQQKILSFPATNQLQILKSDLSAPNLGLDPTDYETLVTTATDIIHCAWPVNFQISLSAFAPSLSGLHNLLQLSLSSPLHHPPNFIFCSSISTALGTPAPANIAEAPLQSLEQMSSTGYAASKLVGERIVEKAVENYHARATILRIGQVVGDTKFGVWNDTEAFPLIIRSALTMKMLPNLDLRCQWLPVDTLARSVLECTGLAINTELERTPHQGLRVYNLCSPSTFSWTRDLLPALAGIDNFPPFERVVVDEWLARLRQLSLTEPSSIDDKDLDGKIGKGGKAADPSSNPALKLVDFFTENFLSKGGAGGDIGGDEIMFDINEAEKSSMALRTAPKIIESGLLAKVVEHWMAEWVDRQ